MLAQYYDYERREANPNPIHCKYGEWGDRVR